MLVALQVPGGSPIAGDPTVWTRTTNDSWMNDGLVTCAQPACTNQNLGGSVRSEFVGSESIAGTYDEDGLGDTCGKESAHGAEETYTCEWNDSTFPKIHNPVSRPSEFSLAVVLPASAGHDGNGLPFHEDFS